VWEDKLVWIVKIDDIKLGDTRYGFDSWCTYEWNSI
jgi:hypothetical protein